MTLTFRTSLAFAFSLLVTLSACTHHYFYVPEIAGDGAMQGKGNGIIYLIPSKTPFFKMKLVSLGIQKNIPGSNKVSPTPLLLIRAYFLRLKEGPHCAAIVLMPSQFELRFSGGHAIYPSMVHSRPASHAAITLGCQPKQAIELTFPLPSNVSTERDLENFLVSWRLHLERTEEHQVARFDREDSSPQQSVSASTFMDDPFYPYDNGPLPGEWFNDEPWWDPFAIQPQL